MEALDLAIRSNADMTLERAAAVAVAFDEHPYLRPVWVGGDPARIKVEPSMQTVVESTGLPIEWLTVRRNERSGSFEGGSIDLHPGRGGWMGEQENMQWAYSLTGHEIEQSWLADTLDAPDALVEVVDLFEKLVVATDAAYGCVLPRGRRRRDLYTAVRAQLPGVYWLNYFGPAFVHTRPALTGVTGARTLTTGGVLIRTTDDPWQPNESGGVPAWQTEVHAIFGEAAFSWAAPNPALPDINEHVAASPGTMEMPWIAWHAQKSVDDRARKHASARKRLAKAVEGRPVLALTENSVEWSTSFDIEAWQGFAKYLTQKLGGDLTTAIGRAAVSIMTTAPLGEEDHILLDTRFGIVSMGWFIDDHDVVDLTLWGAPEVADLCDAWAE